MDLLSTENINSYYPIEKNDWQPGTNFWMILTGNRQPISNLDDLIKRLYPQKDKNRNVIPPYTDINWINYNLYSPEPIKSVSIGNKSYNPNLLIHLSWLGVHDSLRMLAVDPEILNKIKEETLSQKGQEDFVSLEEMPFGLGKLAVVRVLGVVQKKDEKGNIVYQELTNKKGKKVKVPQLKVGQQEITVFLLNSQRLQTPTDALLLVDEIAKLHPETGRRLLTHLLIKSQIIKDQADLWVEALSQKQTQEDLSIPQYLEDVYNQALQYATTIKSQFELLNQGLTQRFQATPLPEELIEKVHQSQKASVFQKEQTPEEIQTTIEKIINRVNNRYQELNEKDRKQKIIKLVEYILRKSQQETYAIADSLTPLLESDPEDWLWDKIAERGQQMLLDNLAPSEAMITLWEKNPNKKAKEKPKNVREWLKAMEWRKEMEKLRRQLQQKEAIVLSQEDQQQYERLSQLIQNKINERVNQEYEKYKKTSQILDLSSFPSYPLLDIDITKIINEVVEKETEIPSQVKDKLQAVFQARSALSQKQQEYTKMILRSVIAYLPGGYPGWLANLGDFGDVMEASPYFSSIFQSLNCANRMVLVSAMLKQALIFEEKDISVLSSYNHTFLSTKDGLGISRAVEPSGYPIRSYYFIEPKNKVFQGLVFGKPYTLLSSSLTKGLSSQIGINYLNYLNSLITDKIKALLLEKYDFKGFSLWNNLSFSFFVRNQNSLDWILALSQAGVIADENPHSFYYFLIDFNRFNQVNNSINQSLEKTPKHPLLPYLKLNLLIKQKTLNNEESATRLQEEAVSSRIVSTNEQFNIEEAKTNCQLLLSKLKNTPLPENIPPPDGILKLSEENITNLPYDKLRQWAMTQLAGFLRVEVNEDGKVNYYYLDEKGERVDIVRDE